MPSVLDSATASVSARSPLPLFCETFGAPDGFNRTPCRLKCQSFVIGLPPKTLFPPGGPVASPRLDSLAPNREGPTNKGRSLYGVNTFLGRGKHLLCPTSGFRQSRRVPN